MKNKRKNTVQAGILRRSWPGMAWGVVLFVLVYLLPGTLWAVNTDYYVDAINGDDTNSGTITLPWQTLNKVNNSTFGEGDQILFKRGETWHESLTIPSSGAAGNPITFGAYGTGDLPLFNGTTTVTWTSSGGGIYSAPLPGSDPGLLLYKGASKPSLATLTFNSDTSGIPSGAVLIQKVGAYSSFWVTSVDPTTSGKVYGITFFQDPAKHWVVGSANTIQLRQLVNGREVKSDLTLTSGLDVDLQSLQQPGDWYWNPTDSNLYLYSDTDPNSIDVQVGALETGILAQGKQYVTIQDVAVQGYQGTGVHFNQTVDSTVQRMLVTNIGAKTASHKTGIMLDHSSRDTIQNNTVDSVLRVGIGIYAGDNATDFSQGNTISSNTIRNTGSSGISLNTNDASAASTVTTNTISGNSIFKANTLAYDSAGVYAIFVGTGNEILSNTILSGGSKELRSAGIMIDQGVAPVVITGNIIENNSLGGIVVTGTGHTITGNRLKYNGVASWQSAQIMFFPVAENVSGSTVKNNIVEAETGKYLFLRTIDPNLSQQSNNDIDYNTYRSRAASTFCWSNDWSCGSWVNFSSWKSTTGHDTNSTFSFITDPPPPDPPAIKSINSTYLLLL